MLDMTETVGKTYDLDVNNGQYNFRDVTDNNIKISTYENCTSMTVYSHGKETYIPVVTSTMKWMIH